MKYLFFLILITHSYYTSAQMPTPVAWEVALHNDAEDQWISLHATIDQDWVVYSQNMNDNGPVPTSFEYSSEESLVIDGVTEELSPVIKKYSELFEMEVKKFKHEAKFIQKINISGHGSIAVDVTFMTCDGNKCLPPKTETYHLKY